MRLLRQAGHSGLRYLPSFRRRMVLQGMRIPTRVRGSWRSLSSGREFAPYGIVRLYGMSAWSDVAPRYERINRTELPDDALQLAEPCWGELNPTRR